MNSATTVGRVMGILLLMQGVIGAIVNFVLLGPAITGPPGFLTNAAANSARLSAAGLLMIVAGAISVAIATTAWPIFKRHSERLALAYFGLGVAGVALAAVESATIMSMLTLSQEYVKSGETDARSFEIVGTVVRYARYWVHYPHLLIGSGTLFLLYTMLFRFALVPRILAGVAMAAVLLQATGLALPFFGNRVNFYLLAPMGVCHLIIAVWLVVKGLDDRTSENDHEGNSAR
jgi:hypothetical protein